ncbi:MAG: hypothetical protein JWM84_2776 [Nocardioides sp.]|nr:hypothetical protein [Nocardioides sp.]
MARISLALEGDVDALLATGVPDLRLAILPERYAALVDAIGAAPRFLDTSPFRGTFLASYAAAYPHLTPADMVEAASVATRLGWAARAVNGHVPEDPGRTQQRLQMFLDGRVGD